MSGDPGRMVTYCAVHGRLGDGTRVCWLPGESTPATEADLRRRAAACEGGESDGLRRLYEMLADDLAWMDRDERTASGSRSDGKSELT